MLTANFYGDTAMPSKVSSALRSRSTAACERRSGKAARSWRWPILAVVLGLFAQQEALAQTDPLTNLTLTDTTTSPVTISLDPPFTAAARSFTATTEVTPGSVLRSVPFGVTQVRVNPTQDGTWTLTYSGAADADGGTEAYERNLAPGSNSIRVTATKSGETTQIYTIAVTRAAEIGSALQSLTVSDILDERGSELGSFFDPTTNTLNFTADVLLSVTTLTVTAMAKPGWIVTYPGEPDVDDNPDNGYQRNLGPGANRIPVTATPTGTSGPRTYTITVTQTTTPSPPRSVSAAPFDESVRLTWTAPSSPGGRPITGYKYRSKEADADNGQWLAADDNLWMTIPASSGSTTSYDVGSLTNGTTYRFQVRAVNENGDGRASNTVEATPAGRLPAPAWLSPSTEAGHRRITLRWTHVNDASVSGYQYQRVVGAARFGSSGSTIPDSDLVESGTERYYTVTDLTNGTEYSFRVRAVNSVGGGAWSTPVSDTPMGRPPSEPTNLRATAGHEQVALSWSAPSDNGGEPITDYEYNYRAQGSDYPARWVATGGAQTAVTVYGLTNGMTYDFKVRALNGEGVCTDTDETGCGDESLEVSATPFGAPDTGVDLTTATGGDRRVALVWLTRPISPTEELSGFQYQQKAGGGYGNWIDVRNSDEITRDYVVGGLTNGTTYKFRVRAVNDAGGGDASNEMSATPSTTPSTPRLTATAGDEEVRLRWTPADDGGSRIIRYECRWREGADVAYEACPRSPLSASATSLTLTDDHGIKNDTTYTFRVRAVNAKTSGDEGWSDEVSARPTDTAGSQRFAISATIDGKAWAKAGGPYTLRATVEVKPSYRERTTLWVDVRGAATDGDPVEFGPTDSKGDASFRVSPSAGYITVALFMGSSAPADTALGTALAVTRVEIRHMDTPDPPAGLVATRGNGEVTLSWATVARAGDYEYRERRLPGSYGSWTDFAGPEFQNPSMTVTSNTVTGLTDGGTYAFKVRALHSSGAPSDPSDEVTVSLSGTVETGGLSAPRDVEAVAGDRQVTLMWTEPATAGGSAITGYQYRQRAGTGAYGQWATIPGGSTARAHTITGLVNGTRYFFRVRAVNADGADGAASPEESATVGTPTTAVDTTLRTLSLSTVALTSIPLTPTFAPATRAYTTTVGNSVAQVTVAASANKAALPASAITITPADAASAVAGHQVALAVGSNTIRVTVADGTSTGTYTVTVTRARGQVPAAPTSLTATAGEAGEGEVTLSWTAPSGSGTISRYDYQQKTATGTYGAWAPIPGSSSTTTSFTVTGLTSGTTYVFRVRAVNNVGNGVASNEATAALALVRLVWAKSEREVADTITAARTAGYGADSTFTAGETLEVRGSSLFNAAEGVSLTFTTASDDPDVASTAASDGTVTVTARAGGMATITITARAPRPSGVTIVDQTDPREASIRFDVEVGLEALTLELSGPEDGTNLVEGGRAHANGTVGTVTVTVEANRPVTEDVTVTLLADRAVSGATAADFEAEPIVIAAGGTTGSTRVTAVEDETAEEMEELVLFGLVAGNGGEVTGEVRLRLWDAAVPALPVIAHLLLAAFLAIGGFRRYLRL